MSNENNENIGVNAALSILGEDAIKKTEADSFDSETFEGIKVERDCGIKKVSSIDVIAQMKAENPKLLGPSELIKGIEPPTVTIPNEFCEAAVKMGIIPEVYKDATFDLERVKQNVLEQNSKLVRKFKVKRFDEYESITNGILATIITKSIPNRSYIIGAPSGFGKTSFVITCLKFLFRQGRRCVPFVSLTDLAQVKVANDMRLKAGLTSDVYVKNEALNTVNDSGYMEFFYEKLGETAYVKRPVNVTELYSWSEFMNADVLFTYFTDVSSKVIESDILKTILTTRGVKGKPTIVMISTSLDPYKNDKNLAEFIWNEILSYKDDDSSEYDRVKHVSCYKEYKTAIETKDR